MNLLSEGYQQFPMISSFAVMDILTMDTDIILFSDNHWSSVYAIKVRGLSNSLHHIFVVINKLPR